MFTRVTPESVGISSARVLDFLKTLDSYNFCSHQILMARGDKIFAEVNYAPFTSNSKHRMYSVSKSFISAALGFAIQDGLMSLDDRLVDLYPDYCNENPLINDHMREATVRDMLTMRSPQTTTPGWIWGGVTDRPAVYFDRAADKVPGTVFRYDSQGSSMISTAIERKTGMPFLEYLKKKCLLAMGFSSDAYCIQAPGGHSFADSGVMCTPRDLLLLARLMMNGGCYDGVRYLDEGYCRDAVKKQTDNNESGLNLYNSYGYGYLIWKTPRDGFAFVGMGDQYAICDPKTDFVMILTSDNQGNPAATRSILYHELYRTIVENLGEALPENEEAHKELEAYASSAKLFALGERTGNPTENDFADEINGKTYALEENPMKMSEITFSFEGKRGRIVYQNAQGENELTFGLGYNEFGKFPETDRSGLIAAEYIKGHRYDCAASADWPEARMLRIKAQVIDEYFGNCTMRFAFKGDQIYVTMSKTAEGFMKDYAGSACGRIKR